MCKAAKELQEAWKPSIGDFYRYQLTEESEVHVYVIGMKDLDWFPVYHRHWLPRLDQLIEMSGKHWSKFLFDVVEYQSVGINESAEMAALYEIMEQKYEKEWNGEDWIKA